MYAVQLALRNAPYASVLAEILANTRTCNLEWVDKPDPQKYGVLVVNEKTLDDLWEPIERPERVVLVAPNEARHLERAWNAGIRSVVLDSDPPRIIALAVLAAALRESRPNTPHRPEVVKVSERQLVWRTALERYDVEVRVLVASTGGGGVHDSLAVDRYVGACTVERLLAQDVLRMLHWVTFARSDQSRHTPQVARTQRHTAIGNEDNFLAVRRPGRLDMPCPRVQSTTGRVHSGCPASARPRHPPSGHRGSVGRRG